MHCLSSQSKEGFQPACGSTGNSTGVSNIGNLYDGWVCRNLVMAVLNGLKCYKCFYSKMMGHRMADCRKRKVDRTDTRNYKTNCALVVRGARNPIE